MHTVNQWQLFNLKKSSLGDSEDLDPDPTNSLSPKTNLPFFQLKKMKPEKDMPHQHLYGTRSNTQTQAIFQTSDLNEDNGEATGWRSHASMFTSLGVMQVKNGVIFHLYFTVCKYHLNHFLCLVLFPTVTVVVRVVHSHGMPRISIQGLMPRGNCWLV